MRQGIFSGTYPMTTSKKDSILARMARLKEEARIVRAIHQNEFPRSETEVFPDIDFEASAGVVSDNDLMRYCGKHKVFHNDKWWKNLKNLKDSEVINRKRRINTLLQACENDNFIKSIKGHEEVPDFDKAKESSSFSDLPKKTIEVTRGWTTTSEGLDLLHFFGYLEAFQKKYPLTWGDVWKAVGFCLTLVAGSTIVITVIIRIIIVVIK